MRNQKSLNLEDLAGIPVEKQLEIVLTLSAKSFTRSEIAEIGAYFKKIYRERARKRQATSTGGKHPQARQKIAEPEERGRVSEAIAKQFGTNRETFRQICYVTEHGNPEQIERLNKTNNVHKLYREIQRDVRRKEVDAQAKNFRDAEVILITGDMREKGKDIPDASVHEIISDLPWGKESLHLWNKLGGLAKRVLVPGGYLFAYTSTVYLDKCLSGLSAHLEFFFPLVVTFDSGDVIFPRNVRNKNRIIAVYFKPPLKLPERCLASWIKSPAPEKELDEWQQREDDLKDWIDATTRPGDTILDPSCGTGSFLVLARKMHRRAIGIDIDPVKIRLSKGRLAEWEERNKRINKP